MLVKYEADRFPKTFPDQGRFYVGAGGGAQAPKMLARPPPKYFGSNSKNTYS